MFICPVKKHKQVIAFVVLDPCNLVNSFKFWMKQLQKGFSLFLLVFDYPQWQTGLLGWSTWCESDTHPIFSHLWKKLAFWHNLVCFCLFKRCLKRLSVHTSVSVCHTDRRFTNVWPVEDWHVTAWPFGWIKRTIFYSLSVLIFVMCRIHVYKKRHCREWCHIMTIAVCEEIS